MKASYLLPNSTQIPDIILDRWMAHLAGAEMKVVLYVARRTYGFRRDSDSISLAQMANGILARDGRRLDYGTGLNKDTITKAIQTLIVKGILIRQRHTDERGGDAPSTYSLNLDSSFGLEGVKAPESSPVGKSDTPSAGIAPQTESDTPLSDNATPPSTEKSPIPVSENPTHNKQPRQHTDGQTDNNKQRVVVSTNSQKTVPSASPSAKATRGPAPREEAGDTDEVVDLIAQMTACAEGMSQGAARALILAYGTVVCRRQLERLAYRGAKNWSRILALSIQEDWSPDASQAQAEAAMRCAERQREISMAEQAQDEAARAFMDAERRRLQAIWNAMSSDEKVQLEEDTWAAAIENAPPPMRGPIERASKSQMPPSDYVAGRLRVAKAELLRQIDIRDIDHV